MGSLFEIAIEDPRADDVRALLAIHLAFSRRATPAEYSFALDVEQLVEPGVTFFSARDAGRLIGVAALKRLDEAHAELKSMHTLAAEVSGAPWSSTSSPSPGRTGIAG